jgi:fermentation-respiration switch protein FrsA (DUF1100 family)
VLTILLYAGVAWLVLVGVMYAGQRSMMYFPDPSEPHPHDHDLPQMESIRIAVDDKVEILAWWHAPADNTHPVLVYFHGNAGHIGERDYKVRDMVEAGYGVLLATYRYNAGGGGKGSERALLADARRAIEFVKGHGIAEQRIVLYGESLGSGVAVAMATEHDVAGLILESPYSSIADVAHSRYWFALAKWLLRDRFDSVARIGKVRAPILLLHGHADRTIPIRFAEKLYDAAPEPKEAHFFPDGGHVDLFDHGADRLVMDFMDRCAVRIRAGKAA